MVVTRGLATALNAKLARESSQQRAMQGIANAVSQAMRDIAQSKAQRSLLDEQKAREDAEKQYQRKVEEEQRAWDRQYKEREYADKQRDAARKRATELFTGLAAQGISPEDIIAKAVGPPPEQKPEQGLFGIMNAVTNKTAAQGHQQKLLDTMKRIGLSDRERQLYDAMANAAKRTRAQAEEDRRRKVFEGKLGNLETIEDIRTSRAKRLAPPDQPQLPSKTREYLSMAEGLFPDLPDGQRRSIAMTWAKEDRDADLALSKIRALGEQANVPGTELYAKKQELETNREVERRAREFGYDMTMMVTALRLRRSGPRGAINALAGIMSGMGYMEMPEELRDRVQSMFEKQMSEMEHGDAQEKLDQAIDDLALTLYNAGYKDKALFLTDLIKSDYGKSKPKVK